MPNWEASHWELFFDPHTGRLLTAFACLAFVAFALCRVRDDGRIRWAVVWAGALSLLAAIIDPIMALLQMLPRWRPLFVPFGFQLLAPHFELIGEIVRTIAWMYAWWLLASALVASRRAEREFEAEASAGGGQGSKLSVG
jgi:hypothetical protein